MSIELQESPPLAPRIAALLAGLRLRIRGYVWTEGLAIVVVMLGLAFWGSLLFDWSFEPPWQFRAGMQAVTIVALLYVFYRFIARRAFRRLDDAELAVVLERRFQDFHDSLLTTVELGRPAKRRVRFNSEMLEHTRQEAAERSQAVHLSDVFRMAPLVRTLLAAAALAGSVLAFAMIEREAFGVWTQRILLLDKNVQWPRVNHVRVQDFPADRIRKVAKGSDFEITVAADLTGRFKVPETVQLRTTERMKGRRDATT